jgi:hypothetical protein
MPSTKKKSNHDLRTSPLLLPAHSQQLVRTHAPPTCSKHHGLIKSRPLGRILDLLLCWRLAFHRSRVDGLLKPPRISRIYIAASTLLQLLCSETVLALRPFASSGMSHQVCCGRSVCCGSACCASMVITRCAVQDWRQSIAAIRSVLHWCYQLPRRIAARRRKAVSVPYLAYAGYWSLR